MGGSLFRYALFLCGTLFLFIIALFTILPGQDKTDFAGEPTVLLVYASAGIMPQLLNTSQIDGFFIWEPVVSTAELGGIGKKIADGSVLPPPGEWKNTACCVLVMRNEFIAEYPTIAALLSALTTAGMERIEEDPSLAVNLTAGWVFGTQPILSAGLSLQPTDVEKHSFQNLIFTGDATIPDITRFSCLADEIKYCHPSKKSFINSSVALAGKDLLSGTKPVLPLIPPHVTIGYLPSSDHYAPLYVAIQDHDTFCKRYGFCFVPEDGDSGRPTMCDLIVDNQTAAYIQLIPGQVGGGVMTGLGQDVIDVGYLGSIPAELQILFGNNASVIQSVNTRGSGLVVDDMAPCFDWNTFIAWIKTRSEKHKPVILATAQSSIQEEMIREALKYEDIHIGLYGVP